MSGYGYGVDVSSGDNYYVCPFLADMSMNITSSASKIALAQEQVSIPGIDQIFRIHLNLADTQDLLNSFTVSGGRNLPVYDNATGGYTDDMSGNTLEVALSNTAAFKGVIEKAINDASNNAGTPLTANEWLNSQLTATLTATILKTLGVAVNVTSSVAIVVAGASENMAAGLTAAANVGKARCETMYLQIKQDTLDNYQDASGNPTVTALPLGQGDKLVFVFDVPAPVNVNVTNQSSSVVNSEGALAAGSVANSGVGADGALTVSKNNAPPFAWDSIDLKYNGPAQRIAFELRMVGTDGSVIPDLTPSNSPWAV
jgi:hypothetical protein